ncbi:MAG: hypothetical protein AB1752_10315 [Candidatus Zixiibacteriota bacterium]
MRAASGLVDLDIAGPGQVELGNRLGHVWNLLFDWGSRENGIPLVAIAENCPRLASMLTLQGHFCGQPVPTELLFHSERLCAIRCYLSPTDAPGCPSFFAEIDRARRAVATAFGVPAMRSPSINHGTLSFRWAGVGMHVELSAACRGDGQIELCINDPKICEWCPSA